MVKEKPNSIRIYDSEGYRRRAACICVRSDLEDEVRHLSMNLSKKRKKEEEDNKCCFKIVCLILGLFFCLFIIKIVLQVLLVTSSRRPDSWIVPGGGVEPDEDPAVTALREVREEAGVLGQLGRCLGIFEVIFIYTQNKIKLLSFFFFMKLYFFYFFFSGHF